MAEGTVFVTGATGLVGTEVVAQLLSTTNSKIYVLVRAASEEEAEGRLRALWWDDATLVNAIGKRVHAITGDITKPTGITTDGHYPCDSLRCRNGGTKIST